ncbi:transcription factor E2F6-like [Xyrichtys novacula]|uniref:Transcription factor E2F6-like n=1 Tax=Xyrichtys novacula TaxID=13765 RepID=A0AAV1GX41_XYRNO|nr:transcription factor E2F6-like [Xyrichtys novacula]
MKFVVYPELSCTLAYVTLDDISCLEAFRDQTVMVVKAPDETRVTILTPAQDHIQVHLAGRDGPITVLTCDFSTESRTDSFMSVEESRIKTSQLHREVFNVFESSGDATES